MAWLTVEQLFEQTEEQSSYEKLKYRELPKPVVLENNQGRGKKNQSKYKHIDADLLKRLNDGKEISTPYIYTKFDVGPNVASNIMKRMRDSFSKQGTVLLQRREKSNYYYRLER